MRPFRRALPLLTLALLLPPAAGAGTVGVENNELVVRMAPGETARLRTEAPFTNPGEPGFIRISHDSGVLAKSPETGCRFPGSVVNGAECPLAGRSGLRFILADTNDDVGINFLPTAVPIHFAGGGGDDQLRVPGGAVTPPDVTMDGGPGNDGLFIGQASPTGIPATATVVGGDGNDELQLNASSRATVDMGAGNDRFTVTSLGQATVDAGDGNDRGVVFAANPAGSRVAGGLGDDGLAIGKGLAGVSTCGPGRDRMQSVREAVALDCERGDQVIPLPGRNGRSTVTFGRSLRSAVRVGPIAFSGRLRVYFAASLSAVRRRVPRIGLVELRVRRGQTVTARLRMSARERARLGSRRSLKGTLVAELRDAGHVWTSFDQFDTLRLPPR